MPDRISELEAALDRLVNYVERAHVHLPSTLMKAEAMGECAAAAEVWWKGKAPDLRYRQMPEAT